MHDWHMQRSRCHQKGGLEYLYGHYIICTQTLPEITSLRQVLVIGPPEKNAAPSPRYPGTTPRICASLTPHQALGLHRLPRTTTRCRRQPTSGATRCPRAANRSGPPYSPRSPPASMTLAAATVMQPSSSDTIPRSSPSSSMRSTLYLLTPSALAAHERETHISFL